MRILSASQARKTLQDMMPGEFLEQANWHSTDLPRNNKLPEDSGAKVAIARTLVGAILSRGPTVLWINEWGVWPSSEHPDLFKTYRAALGESRSLIEAPIHLCEAGDEEKATSILCMALFFCWGAEIFNLNRELRATISHDGWIDLRIATGQESLGAALANSLNRIME